MNSPRIINNNRKSFTGLFNPADRSGHAMLNPAVANCGSLLKRRKAERCRRGQRESSYETGLFSEGSGDHPGSFERQAKNSFAHLDLELIGNQRPGLGNGAGNDHKFRI